MKKLNILLLPILLLFVACEQDTPTSVSPSADEPTKITLAKNPNSESASFGYFLFFASAKASNGETMEIVTDNIFTFDPTDPDPDPENNILTVNPKLVGGTGTFTHRAANGDEIATGAWEATQLLSFKSYGSSPSDVPAVWTAGSANIRVHLEIESGGGAEFDAILMIRCNLPEVQTPPSWVEGIRINVQGGPNFNKTVEDPFTTLFIAL